MLSIGIVASGGVGYYMETVGSGVDDYYARVEAGRWMGQGANVLGLSGEVGAAQVDALVAGRHPGTGEPLGVRVGKVAAFDLTFSAPKSVSLLAEVADHPLSAGARLSHETAVKAALRFLEDEGALAGRRGLGGTKSVRTAGAVAASFVHRTSRAGDPQLHTHALVFNRALGDDDRWAGLDGRRLFAWAKTAGYVYQAALRAELRQRLGVEWQPVVNGIADVAGFRPSQLEAFSNRRAEIEAALHAAGHSSPGAARIATLATRPPKPEPLDPKIQRDEWLARAAEVELDHKSLSDICGRFGEPEPPDVDALAEHLTGPAGLTEHRSAFDRRDVVQALAQASPDGTHPQELRAGADWLLAQPAFASTGAESRHAGALYSTVDLMATEQKLLDSANRRQAEDTAVCPPYKVVSAINARPTLSDEQQAMVHSLCGSGRGVQVVIGRAGTGKTFALDAARDAWTRSGITVIGAALAARTAAALQAGTGIPSTTVDQLLTDLSRPGPDTVIPRRGVIVVDEAGLVGTRKLASLLTAAEHARSKVVLVGDPRQLPEVEAGGAFAVLARTEPVELTTNRRQANEWERAALDQLRHGDVAKAVTVYRDRQRINLAPTAEAARDQLVADWWGAQADKGADRAVMIALHQADVDDLNNRARQLRQLNGGLHGPTVNAKNREFAVGDEVLALRNERRLGILNGTRATITALNQTDRSLSLQTADGRQLSIPAAYIDAGQLAHGYCLTAHKAQGLTVERAFILGSDRLYREAGYAALSRAVERSDLYHVAPVPPRWQPAVEPHQDITRLLSRSAAQTLATQAAVTVDRAAMRDAALADPGAHLVDRLGPPPASGPARDAWAAAATAIDTYRTRHDITGPDLLGPPPAEPEARREWEHAQAAAQQVDRQRELDIDHHLAL